MVWLPLSWMFPQHIHTYSTIQLHAWRSFTDPTWASCQTLASDMSFICLHACGVGPTGQTPANLPFVISVSESALQGPPSWSLPSPCFLDVHRRLSLPPWRAESTGLTVVSWEKSSILRALCETDISAWLLGVFPSHTHSQLT